MHTKLCHVAAVFNAGSNHLAPPRGQRIPHEPQGYLSNSPHALNHSHKYRGHMRSGTSVLVGALRGSLYALPADNLILGALDGGPSGVSSSSGSWGGSSKLPALTDATQGMGGGRGGGVGSGVVPAVIGQETCRLPGKGDGSGGNGPGRGPGKRRWPGQIVDIDRGVCEDEEECEAGWLAPGGGSGGGGGVRTGVERGPEQGLIAVVDDAGK